MQYEVRYDSWTHELPRSERRHFTMVVKADSPDEAQLVVESFSGTKIKVTEVIEVKPKKDPTRWKDVKPRNEDNIWGIDTGGG